MNPSHAWWLDAAFYAIYPLGYCGAPPVNDGRSKPVPRIRAITEDLDRIRGLGFTALYLGPLFESGSHGYDTHDYFAVDRRLGSDDDLAALVGAAHERGLKVVVDGVYNHVGRGFHAFERLREEGAGSAYRSWFRGVDFGADNRFADGFVYDGWEGVEELVELNHEDPAVREHITSAAVHALERYGVDGIRLDVAYALPVEFLDALSAAVHDARPDAWLMGEVIHGDYARLLALGRLDSVTNYECYKGLWSSFNDRNLHEIGHSLDRLFGEGGLLADAVEQGKLPYGFADNHDVDRLASRLEDEQHVFPLYGLLWTMPGIPSVYYGSEYGERGEKAAGDAALRPSFDALGRRLPELARFIAELSRVRAGSRALCTGSYRRLAVDSATLLFERAAEGERVLVAVNADPEPIQATLPPEARGSYECLFSGTRCRVDGEPALLDVPARGVRALRRLSG